MATEAVPKTPPGPPRAEPADRWGLPVLIACVALVLMANLGALPIRGSEGRWAVIGRYMWRSGDLLTPQIGPHQNYWDKPLLSYWQMMPVAWVRGGVDEFSARLPSALWGLVLLFLTYDLARRWFDRRTAWTAAAVLATTWGYMDWGRNAMVEMTNAGVILLALWYFLVYRSDTQRTWVYVLALIMAIGANMKGLTAYAVPGFAILVLSTVRRDWRWFPPVSTLVLAGILSLAVFLVIPVAGCLASKNWDPLWYVWKENVVRFFAPFDHKDPVYTYLYRIFDLAAPWSLLLPAALVYYLRQGRFRESRVRDVLILAGAVFLFFTLSGSRRPYYLLPILPFVAILLGDLLTRFGNGLLPAWTDRNVKGLGMVLGGVMILVAVALPALLAVGPRWLPPNLGALALPGLAVALAGTVMVTGTLKRQVRWMLGAVLSLQCLFALALVPWLAQHPDAKGRRDSLARLRAMDLPVAFLGSDNTRVTFYLDRDYEILRSPEAVPAWAERTRGILITSGADPGNAWVRVESGRKWAAFVPNLGMEFSGVTAADPPPNQQKPIAPSDP